MQDSPSDTHPKQKKALIITGSIFLLCGVLWFLYWLLYSRFYEYTDDAYVDGNQVVITSQVEGFALSFSAIDGDLVEKGHILVELDKTDALIALERAQAELGNAVRNVIALFEEAEQNKALIEVKKAEFVQAAQDYEHRKSVIEEGGVSLEEFEHSIAALNTHFFALNAAEHAYAASFARVQNTTPVTHPLVEKAKNNLKQAYVFYQRCTVRAPVTGLVAQRSIQVGEHIDPRKPLLSLVPLDQMWITANYKETQLKNMRIGQSVTVTTDLYGDGVVFEGKVVAIGGGTGSVFSLLPPQNATGNWIKIVQRLSVRITVDQEMIKHYPLRLGLSLESTVDIHDTQDPYIPKPLKEGPLYQTDIFDREEEGSQALIDHILLENLPSSPEA